MQCKAGPVSCCHQTIGFACRTIADGTCAFPKNLFGCGNHVVAGDVKFISDDIKIECEVNLVLFACSTSCLACIFTQNLISKVSNINSEQQGVQSNPTCYFDPLASSQWQSACFQFITPCNVSLCLMSETGLEHAQSLSIKPP